MPTKKPRKITIRRKPKTPMAEPNIHKKRDRRKKNSVKRANVA